MSHSISTVKIANMALSNIGARSNIESLDEASAEAKQCKLWYDYARVTTLEAFDWSFARLRQNLVLHEDDEPINWSFRYIYPADAIVLRKLSNPAGRTDDAVPYQIELGSDGITKTIITNLESAEAVFTSDITVPSLFSPYFIEALSYKLSHHISFSLTGKLSIKGAMADSYRQMLNWAAAADANEEVQHPPREAEWIRGRN